MAEQDDENVAKMKREFERREVELPVEVEIKGERYKAELQDISEGGMRIQCDVDLPDRGTIKVHLPRETDGTHTKELHVDGIIQWQKKITEVGIEIVGKSKDL